MKLNCLPLSTDVAHRCDGQHWAAVRGRPCAPGSVPAIVLHIGCAMSGADRTDAAARCTGKAKWTSTTRQPVTTSPCPLSDIQRNSLVFSLSLRAAAFSVVFSLLPQNYVSRLVKREPQKQATKLINRSVLCSGRDASSISWSAGQRATLCPALTPRAASTHTRHMRYPKPIVPLALAARVGCVHVRLQQQANAACTWSCQTHAHAPHNLDHDRHGGRPLAAPAPRLAPERSQGPGSSYALSGTDTAYAATRCLVLTPRMPLRAV
eukprot:3124560-Rhodomonas_salina.1